MAWPSPPLLAPCLENLPEGPGTRERSGVEVWVKAQSGVRVQPGVRDQTGIKIWSGIRVYHGGKAQSENKANLRIQVTLGLGLG